AAFEWLVGAFQPKNQARGVASGDIVEITVAIHVERFTVHRSVTRRFVENDLPPVWRDQQPRFAAAVADDIGQPIAGEVAPHARSHKSIAGEYYMFVPGVVRRTKVDDIGHYDQCKDLLRHGLNPSCCSSALVAPP